jgi:EAL domain-containing protein (putative c-di-GMP-specific phosphodiesterase class I)
LNPSVGKHQEDRLSWYFVLNSRVEKSLVALNFVNTPVVEIEARVRWRHPRTYSLESEFEKRARERAFYKLHKSDTQQVSSSAEARYRALL